MIFTSLSLAVAMQSPDLKIEDLKPGKGVAVKPLDLIEVHYTGTLTNGKEFDSSLKRQPIKFQVGIGQVIKGWDQGLLGMKAEGERNLTIPPELAYGEKGAGELIPANSTLKFFVRIVRIAPAATIEVLKTGTGEGLKIGQELECKVSIKLASGKELLPEATQKLSISPILFPGLNQTLHDIKVGERRRGTFGYELGFGEKGVPASDTQTQKAGSIVPPKADVIVEVEALKILS
jgi:FKBP-type peptidyl-prolyl cis-trans isomerase